MFDPPRDHNELLVHRLSVYIPESHAHHHVSVHLDLDFGECFDNPSPKHGSASSRIRHPKYTKAAELDNDCHDHFIRRVVQRQVIGNKWTEVVTPLCHTHPIRGELETAYYGRSLYEHVWDQSKPHVRPLRSVPFTLFIDGFGVYRNSYRSLMGVYVTPCGLKASDRLGSGHDVPLILGPHGSDFGDVVKGLGTLTDLDRGVLMDVDGTETLVCAWTLAFIGDMPQQAENSGFKGPRAHKFCRARYAGAGNWTSNFDHVKHGRFHHQVSRMHATMATLSESEKLQYGTQWGINGFPALSTIAPALDIILSRPFDPAHSEYKGLFELAHFLLRDGEG